MKRSLATVLLSLLLLSVLGPASLLAQTKRRLAVLSFTLSDDARQRAREGLNVQGDLGGDLSDALVAKLVSDGKFTVVERSALDKVIKEQNLSNSDRLDPESAAKIGKIAGVSLIVLGAVTQVSGSDKPTATGLAAGMFSGFTERKASVSVSATVRIIDTNTGAILATATGAGDATNVYRAYKSAKLDTSGKNYGNGTMNEAVTKAINSIATQLEAVPNITAAPQAPRTPYKGIVADVTGNTLILTVGKKNGARVGDVVEITRVSKTVYRPGTKEVLKVVSMTLGTATLTEVDEGSATATFTSSGEGTVATRDAAILKE